MSPNIGGPTLPADPEPAGLSLDRSFIPGTPLSIVTNRECVRVRYDEVERKAQLDFPAGALASTLGHFCRERAAEDVGPVTMVSWDRSERGYLSIEQVNRLVGEQSIHLPVSLKGVRLAADEVDGYYNQVANGLIWPVMHGISEQICRSAHECWKSYYQVNRRFAEAALEDRPSGGFIWVHDYHLMLVPKMLRRLAPEVNVGYFHHIPFPNRRSSALTSRPQNRFRCCAACWAVIWWVSTSSATGAIFCAAARRTVMRWTPPGRACSCRIARSARRRCRWALTSAAFARRCSPRRCRARCAICAPSTRAC